MMPATNNNHNNTNQRTTTTTATSPLWHSRGGALWRNLRDILYAAVLMGGQVLLITHMRATGEAAHHAASQRRLALQAEEAARRAPWSEAAYTASLVLGGRVVCTTRRRGTIVHYSDAYGAPRSSVAPAGGVYLWAPRASRAPPTPRAEAAAALAALRDALCVADERCARLRGALFVGAPGRAYSAQAPTAAWRRRAPLSRQGGTLADRSGGSPPPTH